MPDARSQRLPLLVFACLLALGSFLFYFGDIGKWREDFVWTMRDPVSGRNHWAGIFELPFFWRPCSMVYVRGINTLFWDFDPPRLWLAAAAHVWASWMLFRALRAFHTPVMLAAFGAMSFMVLPQGYEVPLWPSATPTAIATGLFLYVLIRIRRDPSVSPRSLLILVGIAALIPCWNEQPAAGLAALPLLVLALDARPLRRSLGRAIAVAAACCIPCAVYVALYLLSSPPEGRGGAGSYASTAELPGKALTTLGRAADFLAGRQALELVRGSLQVAAGAILSVRGIAWLIACIAAAVIWLRRSGEPALEVTPLPRRALVIAFGVFAALVMLIPIMVISASRVEPRMLYPPFACLVIAACVALAPLARLGIMRSARVPIAAAWVVILLTGGVCLIGYQTLLRRRSEMDWREVRALKALVPNPPPDTLFLAARVSASAAGTYQGAFNRAEFGAWTRDAYGCCLLRQVYGRVDLYSKRLPAETEVTVGEDGVTAAVWMRVGYTRRITETRRFPWDHVVVFAVEPDDSITILPAGSLIAPAK